MSDLILMLPTNGSIYGNEALFTGIKMKHQKHLAKFQKKEMPRAIKYEAMVEVFQEVVAIEGLEKMSNLAVVDFDFLAVAIRMASIPEGNLYTFGWECDCGVENTDILDLSELVPIPYDGKEFRVDKHKFTFLRVGDLAEILARTEEMKNNLPEDVNSVAYDEALDDLFMEEVKLRAAACLITERSTTLDERFEMVENDFDYQWYVPIKQMIGRMMSYGLPATMKKTCSKCDQEVSLRIPFREITTFI